MTKDAVSHVETIKMLNIKTSSLSRLVDTLIIKIEDTNMMLEL